MSADPYAYEGVAAQDMPEDVMALMNQIAFPLDRVSHNCHAVSLAIVKSRIYPGARVARGSCKGVMGQHSWVALGDPYDDHAGIIDATLWSYDPAVKGVWTGALTGVGWRHRPQGYGHFFRGTRPEHHGGETVVLKPAAFQALSVDAIEFLDMLGPLDIGGWMMVGNLPMQGWPAREIIEAMLDSDLGVYVPIDIVGMVTDRNPSGLYLAGVLKEEQ